MTKIYKQTSSAGNPGTGTYGDIAVHKDGSITAADENNAWVWPVPKCTIEYMSGSTITAVPYTDDPAVAPYIPFPTLIYQAGENLPVPDAAHKNWTIQAEGDYIITATLCYQFGGATAGRRGINIHKNSAQIASEITAAVTVRTGTTSVSTNVKAHCNEGDVINVQTVCSSTDNTGGPINCPPDANRPFQRFTITRIG